MADPGVSVLSAADARNADSPSTGGGDLYLGSSYEDRGLQLGSVSDLDNGCTEGMPPVGLR